MENENRVLNINIGILGHVDSGKTSLVKALSTSLSTAALDKHPQSQQRGITLDLGFSAFTLPLSDRIQSLLVEKYGPDHGYDLIQFTLVDCPGHASLIRTIIGGAQIIDMIILVVDANKGIQTQTAECIVIGEITTDIMIIALNKVDLLPEHEREERVAKISKKIRKTLSNSKFSDIIIIPVSASIGGEKVAATAANPNAKGQFKSNTASEGVDRLVESIKENVAIPSRNIHASFYFAIDHCFPIKGHGTVMTGTVLSGSVSVNQTIEIPQLQVTKKVKSMQMFHKPVKYAKQGDRVGICVTNLDAKLIERGIAATPNTIPLIHSAVCLVKKIRYFRYPCRSNTKFHISIGHETVVANAIFFGGNELSTKIQSIEQEKSNSPSSYGTLKEESEGKMASTTENHDLSNSSQSTLTAAFQHQFPTIDFDWDNDHCLQDGIITSENAAYGKEAVQWVLLQFQQPVYCPLGSLIIGSRLDVDTKDHAPTASTSTSSNLISTNSTVHQCRLAFYGPIKDLIPNPETDLHRLGIFIWKQKECEISRLVDVKGPLCYEAIGWRLITEGGNIQNYIGMKVLTERGIVGTIISSYGADGKFRVKFPNGAKISVGGKLIFKYKKFLYQKNSKNFQQNIIFDENQKEEITKEDEQLLLSENIHERKEFQIEENDLISNSMNNNVDKMKKIMKEKKKNEKKKLPDKDPIVETSTNSSVGTVIPPNPDLPPAPKPVLTIPPAVPEEIPVKEQPSPLPALESLKIAETKEPIDLPAAGEVAFSTLSAESDQEIRMGKLESVKAETSDGSSADIAIVSGAFKMEENIKLFIGSFSITENNETGELIGSFGKLGKCKIKFPGKCNAPIQSTVKIVINKKK